MMKGKMTVINTDGAVVTTVLTAPPSLDALQKAVGGYIEVVPYLTKFEGTACVAFCNEEGKLNELPVNAAAQKIWEQAFGETIFGDILVGPIVIISGDDELLESL